MIYKRCPHCGKRVPEGSVCNCGWHRKYGQNTKENKYRGYRWQKLREQVMQLYGGMDPYALHVHNRLEAATIVHHIVPAEMDQSRFYDIANLIPLSRQSHAEVHKLYDTSHEAREGTQELLQSLTQNSTFGISGEHTEGIGGGKK